MAAIWGSFAAAPAPACPRSFSPGTTGGRAGRGGPHGTPANKRVEGPILPARALLRPARLLPAGPHLAALCRLLPERDPHPRIHAALASVLDCLTDARRAGPELARFELMLLGELGFGLDLERCAATGTTADLTFVSPRSGRAVSRV